MKLMAKARVKKFRATEANYVLKNEKRIHIVDYAKERLKSAIEKINENEKVLEVYNEIAGPLEDRALKAWRMGEKRESKRLYGLASEVYREIGFYKDAAYCAKKAGRNATSKKLEKLAA